MEVMPVRRVNSTYFKAGDIARLLLKKYREEVNGQLREKKGESPLLW
jgi:hypothetical protein